MNSSTLCSKSLVDVAAQYPIARQKQERWVAYLGPTNSGKSYQAFNALAQADSGLYLAPLRLLAMEGQQQLVDRGQATSLLTGDARDLQPGARFTAATVEMLNLVTPVDAGVIDEIQLLRDPARGWAWTQALLGMPARTVYLTGSPDIADTLYALAEHVGVPLEIVWTERLVDLTVHTTTTRLKEVRKHTAVVAFGRQQVLTLRAALESRRLAVAVIYGDLTPAVRREEARRFTDGEADVLIATDAIALGLNLHIETVLFAATTKFDGEVERALTDNEVRQIGGRAGRFGQFEMGYVGALEGADLGLIQRAMEAPLATSTGLGDGTRLPAAVDIRPTRDALIAEAGLGDTPLHHAVLEAPLGTDPNTLTAAYLEQAHRTGGERVPRLAHVATRYVDTHQPFSGLFQFTLGTAYLEAAQLVDEVLPLPFLLKTLFACAPVDLHQPLLRAKFTGWAWAVATGHPVHVASVRHHADLGYGWAHDEESLQAAEQHAQLLLLYAWLHQRLPDLFPDGHDVATCRAHVDGYIMRTLARPMALWFSGAGGSARNREAGDAFMGGSGSLAPSTEAPHASTLAPDVARAFRQRGHTFFRRQPAPLHFTAPRAGRMGPRATR